ncbi:hypothetical protein EDC01DRAFT_630738 [Geopyxis carbonaria]|nr:hypothetical protein EDC01DRAFT_630738 [Geopyxis carbonaria]
MMTRTKTFVLRLAELAQQILDAEAKLKVLDQQIAMKGKVIESKDKEIAKKDKVLADQAVKLGQQGQNIQQVLTIKKIQPNDKVIRLPASDITFTDWESISDWSGYESL